MSNLAGHEASTEAAPAVDVGATVLELEAVCKSFAKPSGEPLRVLADIDLTLREGEILGLLGRSGSGKSTLLRIAAGLVKPTSGTVRYRGRPLAGPTDGIAVVFQTFALYPWLTVLENVELGLDALSVAPDTARERAIAAIELIGLDGFESAFPRELSGGMRQRVGFARALVSEPTLLLMDEPFSALDVLTAETLRTDFLDLWGARQLPIKAVMMVTHNIEEAVLMCDRIQVLGTGPGHVEATLRVGLPHPRNRRDPAFQAIVGDIYAALTARIADAHDGQGATRGGLAMHLPDVSSHHLVGFIEALAAGPHDGHAELGKLASTLALRIDALFPLAAALHILEFAEWRERTIRLTAAGHVFARSGDDERRRLFREHLVQFVPLAAHVGEVLDEREGHRAPRERFELELEDHLDQRNADQALRVVIDWGRYAGLFDYDDHTRTFGR
ncbi:MULTISPECIES: ABC transporter ATP-binding protein [Burkholderia]|uniref:Nitrate ABC transporter ATP-binding protein n=1 Tax=Burkholderia savannae TaxID=1637837 RepID=A0ABR5T8V8_9BURK|nr:MULTISPECIES: nitrate/sulfonate/bicarbonate ABC transporter ATP-binding protein [Burkholderia]AOJ73599.1 nitrate ABC transporter ATP-binding protein [Burkholderia savannae]KVG48281.1 nitrate ABC transporter ATP-binding protein [Burkholderia sp. MSMB0265]KVG84358.1 nitrate ABC transporter ATP-binding protein [Burkholderia sp. MSMB2040]KVG92152.1 nitrate ABC transporter ATP-binding protein [Burkholderia sp. MSMB2042]KVG93934.1 nitrate ABC transporter ATP-binding protein [Burkholderia sp. MSMB